MARTSTKFNRLILLVAYMGLAGYLASMAAGGDLTIEQALAYLLAAGAPVTSYVSIKGQGTIEPPKPTEPIS